MVGLVGYTGFVGSNIYACGGIDAGFNSKNIKEAYGLRPDLLIYAGLRAEKYLANSAPEKDMELIRQAEENIRKIAPEKLVLISTIDVFKAPKNVDEKSPVDTAGLQPYGYDRYLLEQWVRENYPDALIVRLPGLFGINIKKNFIYDMINRIPSMLKPGKYEELSGQAPELAGYYMLQENGFYQCRQLETEERARLRQVFMDLGFTALNFTDSRSRFQFYPLARLWDDIQVALKYGIRLWHPATEPVSAAEVYRAVCGREFVNLTSGVPADYDYRTIHDRMFGGVGGYICGKDDILRQLKAFVKEQVRQMDMNDHGQECL